MKLIYIACFGLLGIFIRYYSVQIASRFLMSSNLPVATFMLNVIGAFLIGVVFVLGVERTILSPDLRLGLTVGLLGGMTTFSSYCLEAVSLAERGELFYAMLYLGLSAILGFAGAFLGILLTRGLLGIDA